MAQAHIFGSHTVPNGGIDMAVRRAAAAGLKALQIFSAIPKFYGDNTGIREDRVERFRAALEETGIRPEHVVVHGAYVLNTANPEDDKWARAAGGLIKELERSTLLGAGMICYHPGSAKSAPVEEGIRRAGLAITRALESMESDTRVLVENTAGAGRTIGRTAAEVGAILDHVPPALRQRTGYGLDTCHLYASGYDIGASEPAFRGILDEFEAAVGESPSFFHLNDSEGALGSNRDRHALLGEGEIGVEPFRWLLADPRSRGIPLVLETPQANPDIADDDPAADPWDIRMRELLESLVD